MADPRRQARRLVLAIPGSLETPTGGYRYDKRVMAELAAVGWHIDVLTLGESFPDPSQASLASAYRRLAQTPPGVPLVVDGLALGAMPDIGQHLPGEAPLVALVHHPLAEETGLSPERVAFLRHSETAALAAARLVIASSAPTAEMLAAGYGVPPTKIRVAPPGVDRQPRATGHGDGIVRLLAVGAVTPRKGHDLLVAALSRLRNLPWHLTIVGDVTRAPAAVAHLRAEIARSGLMDRVTLTGAITDDALAEIYAGCDLFVLASRFEGYGMVFTEALVRGLPVVATSVGAAPEMVPSAAGAVVPPENVDALAAALRRLIADPEARTVAAEAAWTAREKMPLWSDTTAIFQAALTDVLGMVVEPTDCGADT